MKCPHCGNSIGRADLIKRLSTISRIDFSVLRNLTIPAAAALINAFENKKEERKNEKKKAVARKA